MKVNKVKKVHDMYYKGDEEECPVNGRLRNSEKGGKLSKKGIQAKKFW